MKRSVTWAVRVPTQEITDSYFIAFWYKCSVTHGTPFLRPIELPLFLIRFDGVCFSFYFPVLILVVPSVLPILL